jgi:hypothetical protein
MEIIRRKFIALIAIWRSFNEAIEARPPGQRALITVAIVVPALALTFLAEGLSLEHALFPAILGSTGGAFGGAIGRRAWVNRNLRRAQRGTNSLRDG